MTGVFSDLRLSARTLLRSPGVAAALLLTIALGIGSNVAIYGFVRGLTAPRIPAENLDGVVSIFGGGAAARGGAPVSFHEFRSLASRRDAFEWIGAARLTHAAVTLAGRPSVMRTAAVTGAIARLLRLDLNGGVIVSNRVWERDLNRRGGVVGIAEVDLEIAGVAPPGLDGLYAGRPIDLWLPMRDDESNAQSDLWVIAKLRPHVTPDKVSDTVTVVPYTGMTPDMASALNRVRTLLDLAAALVLLIACANVASFQLSRADRRSHETSIRVALGAGRGHLARSVLSDSVIVSLAGGALGLVLARWTSRVIPGLLFEEDAGSLVLAPDLNSAILASLLAVGIIIVCGLAPVLETPHARPASVLRREGSGGHGRASAVRTVLVAAQMACCCLLVISGGYLYQGLRASLQTTASRNLGTPVLATVQADPNVGLTYFRDIERAAQSVADVSLLGWTGRLPGAQPAWRSFFIEPADHPVREIRMDVASFTAESVDRFLLPPVSGRLFSLMDRRCRTAIVNEEAAAVLYGDATAGRTVYDSSNASVVIIGVAAPRNPERPTIYYDATDPSEPPFPPLVSTRFRASALSRLPVAELNTGVVSPAYFRTAGFSVVAGRIFADDPARRSCRVAVVNREAAALHFSGNAVGAALIDEAGRRTEVIGVVEPGRLGAFEGNAGPSVYFPMEQDHLLRMTLLLGAPEAGDTRIEEVRRTLELVPGSGPQAMIVRSLEAYLSQTALAPLRIATLIIGASAVTGLLLGLLGLYGALSDTARRQRRETAVRIALGARRRNVIARVLRPAGQLAAVGTFAGIAGAVLLSNLLSEIAPGSGAPALWVWLAGPAVLAGAVGAASILPTRRSLMVDPVRMLRDGQ